MHRHAEKSKRSGKGHDTIADGGHKVGRGGVGRGGVGRGGV